MLALQLSVLLAPSAAIISAVSTIRRRVQDVIGHDGAHVPIATPPPSSTKKRVSPALLALAAGLLLALGAACVGLVRIQDSWGNRWVLQRSCKLPTTAKRLAAWGNLRGFNHGILTRSPQVQQFFNQGLLLAWDFNREESTASFQACQALDPSAAMCRWGLAYAGGPFLNVVEGEGDELFPVFGPQQFQIARDATQEALRLAEQAAQRDPQSSLAQHELAMCRAAAERFAEGTRKGPARAAAERRYAEAMQALGEEKEDATALALAAEGLLNLCPWDFVDRESGATRPEAHAAEALLLRALRLAPNHELALHLHVHLAEVGHGTAAAGAAEAGRGGEEGFSEGERSADRLSGLQPRMGHLQHMPSHMYIRVGRYANATAVNFQAYEADVQAAERCLQSYIPEHNVQMLMYAASMAGQYGVLEEWGAKMWGLPDIMPRSAWPGRESTMLLLAQVRFAMWDQVLATPSPKKFERGPGDPGGFQFAQAAWRFSRCLALASAAQRAQQAQHAAAARQHRKAADTELLQLREAVAALPPDLLTRPGQPPGIYSPGYTDLGSIAVTVAEARLLALDGRWHEAVAALRSAAEVEAAGGYVEPPRLLHQPVAECLGWALMHIGLYEEAVGQYRADLARHPGNGWALLGLAQALSREGRSREAAAAREAFERAWAHADRAITNSCPAFAW